MKEAESAQKAIRGSETEMREFLAVADGKITYCPDEGKDVEWKEQEIARGSPRKLPDPRAL